jgi:hypothetical protein
VGAGEEFLWDSDHLRFTNSEAANHYVKPEYRDGWQIKGLS